MDCYVGAVGGGRPRYKKCSFILVCLDGFGWGSCCFRLGPVVDVVVAEVLGEGVVEAVDSRLCSSGKQSCLVMLQLFRKYVCSLRAVIESSCGEARYCSVRVMTSLSFSRVFSCVVMLCSSALFSVEKKSVWYCLVKSIAVCLCSVSSKIVGIAGTCFLGIVLCVSVERWR